MKKILSLMAITATITWLWSCKSDETTPDGPTITAPSVTSVQVSTSADVTFAVTVPGGFKSASASATGGSATVKTALDAGAKSGNVVITFTADATAGAGSTTLTVTDNNNKTSTQTGVINKTEEPVPEKVVVSGLISESVTWTSDKIYELAGRVIVDDGVTLTIQAGTLIKGREGNGSLATALIISRGGKIMAQGTAEAPIIFTAVLDNIEPGEVAGTNLTKEDNELWGGLIILGKAHISAKDGDTEASIEGLPADEAYGLYGGTDDADNSGTLEYVSIRHGGTLIGEGNEINGLTLGGVGSGTTIDHIEIFATLDDGIEFFGGTVNVSNVLIYWQGDDGLDIDQNYAGTIDNFLVMHGGADTDEGTEIDGPENATYTDGTFTIMNGKFVGDEGTFASAADLKDGAQGSFDNVIWTGYTGGAKVKFEGEYNASCVRPSDDAVQKLIDGIISFTSSNFGSVKVYAKAGDGAACSTTTDQASAAAAAGTSDTEATGPDETEFAWTSAAQLDLL